MKRIFLRTKEGIYFTDMSKCSPSSAISDRRCKTCWKKITYETENFKGILLTAFYSANPPVITFNPELKGAYRIFAGLYGEFGTDYAGIRIKLKSDHCFNTLLFNNRGGRGDFIYEVFWKEANLTGQAIEISPLNKRDTDSVNSGIAYIRLLPADKKSCINQKSDIYLAAFNDAFSFVYYNRPTTKTEIQEQIEIFRDTPFKKIYWGIAIGDVATYPTKIGSQPVIDLEGYPRLGDKNYAESHRVFRQKNMDILKIAIEHAKKIGLEFHVYHRMGLVAGQPPWEEMMYSRFFYENQRFLCYDRDGTKISRLSYAYPEVQNHCIDLFREVASYGIDGINFAFHRGVPLVLFEKPIIEGFKKKYGQDPRELPDSDLRLFEFRSNIITDYLRRVRQEFPCFELSATVLINEENNRFYNLDIKRWIDEKIIDVLIPYPQDRGLPHRGIIDMDYFSSLVKRSDCQLCPELRATRSWMTVEEHYLDLAEYFYRYNIDGICFWDTDTRFVYPEEWRIINSLCKKQGLKKRIKNISKDYKKVTLKKLNGYSIDKYPYWWSY